MKPVWDGNQVVLVADDDPLATGDQIGASLAKMGVYTSPEGWAIVTGSPGDQLGGAPRIITEAGGKQPPADVLARYPMASPQENQGFQQQAAQYRSGEGKPVPFSTAILAALGSYGAGSAFGNFMSPAASAVAPTGGTTGSFPTWMQPTAGGVADTGFGAGTVPADGVQAGVDAANSTSPYSLNGVDGNTVSAGTLSPAASVVSGGGGSFQNPDGSFGSTMANSGPGGVGVAEGVGASTGNTPWMNPASLSSTALASLASTLGTTPDALLKGGGALVSGLLGAMGASQQQAALKSLSDQYMAFGAPSRARYEASFQPGFTMASDPGYQDSLDATAKATSHALSINGNPGQSPNAWAATLKDVYDKTAYPALQQYRNQNAATGGTANFSTGAQDTAVGAIGAGSNIFGAVGKSIANVTNPPQTLSDWIASQNSGSNIFKSAAA